MCQRHRDSTVLRPERPVDTSEFRGNRDFWRLLTKGPQIRINFLVLSCIYLGHNSIVSIRIHRHTHKLFSICDLVVAADPQYEQAAIRFHCKNICLPPTVSAEQTVLTACTSQSSLSLFSSLFFCCKSAHNQLFYCKKFFTTMHEMNKHLFSRKQTSIMKQSLIKQRRGPQTTWIYFGCVFVTKVTCFQYKSFCFLNVYWQNFPFV